MLTVSETLLRGFLERGQREGRMLVVYGDGVVGDVGAGVVRRGMRERGSAPRSHSYRGHRRRAHLLQITQRNFFRISVLDRLSSTTARYGLRKKVTYKSYT